MRKYRIGILTYHRAINYGAFLQAYALCNKLNAEDDIEAEIIDFQMNSEREHYSTGWTITRIKHPIRTIYELRTLKREIEGFNREYNLLQLSNSKLTSNSCEEFTAFVNGKYDIIISGSDEIWKTDGFRGFPTPYWLPGKIKTRKMSYAASARNDFDNLSAQNQNTLCSLLEDFEFIGVRDKKTKSEVSRFTNHEVHLCYDPTFLWEFHPNIERGRQIINARTKTKKKILAIMSEDLTISRKLMRKLGKEFEMICLYHYQPGCIDLTDLSPFEWLDVIAAVDIIVTSYFHAVCFSEKFAVPVIALGTKSKISKVKELLVSIKREDDLVEDFDNLCKKGLRELVHERLSRKTVPLELDGEILGGYQQLLKAIRREQ